MSRSQNRRGGAKRTRDDEWRADLRDPSSLQNISFETFYKAAGVIPEGQWDAFMDCLRTSLPVATRVNLSTPNGDKILEDVIGHLSADFETKRLPFFPGEKAVQSGVSRGDLKRNAQYKSTKKAISALNEGGYLTRQETVSMLPPLLLQVQPGHRVLDMCAAPGSKTSQILEMLISDIDTGVVVANDVNPSRLDVLHHQTNRAAGAHPHLIITNYDATRFPILPSEWKFDRVLCDVMCSGDGTLRKSVDMWPRWNPLQAADLHVVQSRVLLRGMASCRKGGIVVYSTCSLNPVEDEAVVSECLRQANGAFRLIDPNPLLPGLVSCEGVTSWALTTKDLSAALRTFEEAQAYNKAEEEKDGGKRQGFQYKASMFADTPTLEAQNIRYARRILPQQQDTGGFFIAALECVEELPIAPTVLDERAAEVPVKPISEAFKVQLRRAFGLKEGTDGTTDFVPLNRLVVRNEEAREQKVYYANQPTVELAARLGNRITNVGSKIFESYSKFSNEKLRFTVDGAANAAQALLRRSGTSSFVFQVGPDLILDMAEKKPLSFAVFATRLGIPVEQVPTTGCILACQLDLVGPIYTVAELHTQLGAFVAKVQEWQVTLCKLQLGIPLVTEAPAENAEEGEAVARTEQATEPADN